MMQMQHAFHQRPKLRMLALAFPLLALITGCAGKFDPQRDNEALETPPFLSSPAMAMITNTDGFTARVVIQSPSSLGTKTRTGQMYGRGSQLLFMPDYEKHFFGKQRAADKTCFVWDVGQSKGYVLNEALQGYAPYSISARVTTLAVTDVESVFNDFDGHRCRRGEASIGVTEGPDERFTVWRAGDLKGFPMQIKAGNGQYVVNFSKLNFERVGASLFTPPEGFTEHPSPGAMLSTLLEREVANRKKTYEPSDADLENTPEPGRPRPPR